MGIVDLQQRKDALDASASFCVSAPAGSGKTELLVQRILVLLARVEKPEQVLAITFTRKAAAEMRQRIIEALASVDKEKPQAAHQQATWLLAKEVLEHDVRQNWQLRQNPSRLKIHTIDGFCSLLTRQMPILSAFGSAPKVSDRPQQLYQAAVQSLLACLDDNDAVSDDLAQLLIRLDYDYQKVERLLVALLAKRDQWLVHIGFGVDADGVRSLLESFAESIVTSHLRKLRLSLSSFAADIVDIADFAGSQLLQAGGDSSLALLAGLEELPAEHSTQLDMWLLLAEIFLTKDNSWRKKVNKNQGFIPGNTAETKAVLKNKKQQFTDLIDALNHQPEILLQLAELRYLPQPILSEDDWQFLKQLIRLLTQLVAHLQVVFSSQGEVDYNQVSIAAIQALGDGEDPTDLSLRLDYQIKHILIDEFQDTSSTQFALLSRLIEGWPEHNYQNPLAPNTLFIVGDGMQSIYRFREANVALFIQSRQHGVNGLNLNDTVLQSNFRSKRSIVDWINQAFSFSFPTTDDVARGAVSYSPSHAIDQANGTISLCALVDDTDGTAEATYIVDAITRQKTNKPDSSIAVLVRSRGHLEKIIPALNAAYIDWNANDIDPLLNREEIQDLLTLSKALFNVADQIAWLALLRSPFLGLNNSELYAVLKPVSDQSRPTYILSWLIAGDFSNFSEQRQQQLQVFTRTIRFALQNRRRKSLREYIEGVWCQLGGGAILNTQTQLDNVQVFFDLLEQLSTEGYTDIIHRLELAIESVFSQASPKENAVQIMTIHKSKGLEFDTVILPSLHKTTRNDSRDLLQWGETVDDDGQVGLLLAPLTSGNSIYTKKYDNSIYEYLRYMDSSKAAHEDTRLFYVACTRAISNLVLLFKLDSDQEGQIKPPASKSLIAKIYSCVQTQIQYLFPEKLDYQEALIFEEPRGIRQLSPVYLKNLPIKKDAHEAVVEDIAAGETESSDGSSMHAAEKLLIDNDENIDGDKREWGIVVHRILEDFGKFSLKPWQNMNKGQRQLYITQCAEDVSNTLELDAVIVGRVQQYIEKILDDKDAQWILDARQNDAQSEQSISGFDDNGVYSAIIDRTFVDSNNVRWIVDYKTAQKPNKQSEKQFITAQIQQHQQQLQRYKQLYASTESREIRTGIYFTSLAKWCPIEL